MSQSEKDDYEHGVSGGDLNLQSTQGVEPWSRHLKHENPQEFPTFRKVIKRLSDYFDVEVYATRLNIYPDGSHWKPQHHDSHAYSSEKTEVTGSVYNLRVFTRSCRSLFCRKLLMLCARTHFSRKLKHALKLLRTLNQRTRNIIERVSCREKTLRLVHRSAQRVL